MRLGMTICAGALLLGAAPAVSQTLQAPKTRPIMVSADAPFAHAGSGVTLPPTLIAMARREVQEIEAPQLDLAAVYSGDGAELTVYVTRATSGSVPVWFDRARWAIDSLGRYGTPAPVVTAEAIAPPGTTVASGLLSSWTVGDAPVKMRGTGVALLPLGEWLVKLRYSSTTLDGAGVAERLRAAVAGLGWPAGAAAAPPAAAVAACNAPLKFKGQAKAAPRDMASMLLGAVVSGVPAKATQTSAPATWCRDPAALPMGAVYRSGTARDAYLLALSDAGRGIWVAPSMALPGIGSGKPTWAVDLVLPGRTITFPPQDRLPSPERVMEVARGGGISSVTTWGKDRNVNLSQPPSGAK